MIKKITNKKKNPRILKDDFSFRAVPFIFTSIGPV